MSVQVKRIQRRQFLGNPASPMLYYLKQDESASKTFTIESIAAQIETTGALSAEDVTHTMQSFIRELKKQLTQGNKVKVAGLGTFHTTLTTTGTAQEKDCTVRTIRRVNVRFYVDNSLRLVNDSTATTRNADNNVKFAIKTDTVAAGDTSGSGGGAIVNPGA